MKLPAVQRTRWGADVDSDSKLSYEYFDDCGKDCPVGFYNTLNVELVDR